MRPAWVVIFLYFPRWIEIGVGSKTMEVVSVVVGKKKNEDVIEQGGIEATRLLQTALPRLMW